MPSKHQNIKCELCDWYGRSDTLKRHMSKHEPQVPQVPQEVPQDSLLPYGCPKTDTIMWEGNEIQWKPWYDKHYFDDEDIPQIKVVRKILCKK